MHEKLHDPTIASSEIVRCNGYSPTKVSHSGDFQWFLLGTGRMPHPVGGAMGVALCTAVKGGHTRFDIISLNIHKETSRWHLPGCCTLTSTADLLLGKAPNQLFYSSS